ncbi:MAG: signal peptidase II [Dehalococcoidales bacterium]|nr:signal peptidase II [Dehalococcoidales bacterium]
MAGSPRPRDRWWQAPVLAGIALLDIVADQISKWWVREQLLPGQVLFDAGLFRIIHVQNTGAAFGVFQGHGLIFTIVDFIGIGVLIGLLVVLGRIAWLDRNVVRVAIVLVLGGTVGNLIDRLWLGHVTDFIDFKVWPVFNVADSAITVGVVTLALSLLLWSRSAEDKGSRP